MSSAPVVVTIYVRHSADCKYRGDGEFEKRCRCRKHLRWTIDGVRHRLKAGTRSWAEAEQVKRDMEEQLTGRTPDPERVEKSIHEAAEVFIADKTAQGVTADVVGKYRRELDRLCAFAVQENLVNVSGLSRELLIRYREQWGDLYPSSNTRQMVQARLRNFLRFCYESRWLERVPRLSSIRAAEAPTLPLTPEEYKRLLAAVPVSFPDVVNIPASGKMSAHTRAAVVKNRAGRLRALVQLMRYSGLAIRDAVTLERAELVRDETKDLWRVVTARQKTGTHVSVPLPPDVAQEVLTVLNGNPRYVFWTGHGEERTAVSHWQDDFRQLFKDAGLYAAGGNMVSHRLRDTFAVDLLEKGVPLEEVSKLLGHESIKTTEKSYAKWVKGRQDRLDSLVMGTWAPSAKRKARRAPVNPS